MFSAFGRTENFKFLKEVLYQVMQTIKDLGLKRNETLNIGDCVQIRIIMKTIN